METEPSPLARHAATTALQGSEVYGRLGDATQRLVAAVFEAGNLDDGRLVAFVADLERIADRLEVDIEKASDPTVRHRMPQGHSPTAPALDVVGVSDRFRASARLGAQFEGPPNFVHGGWIAYAFDEVLGRANATGTFSGMTAELRVRYLRPTPTGAEAVFEAQVSEQQGRTSVLNGTLSIDGEITCEATAVFVSRRPQH